MKTRTRAMEEQLASMAEHLSSFDSVFPQLESLCSTVQQHSKSFVTRKKNHEESVDILHNSLIAQQKVMAEMILKLQSIDR